MRAPSSQNAPSASTQRGRSLIGALQQLNRSTDFAGLVQAVLTSACELFGGQAAALLLVNRQTGCLELAAVKDLPETLVQKYQIAVPAPSREAGRIVWPLLVQELAAGELGNGRIWPIRLEEKLIGVLTLASTADLDQEGDPDGSREAFLIFCAQAIENAFLFFQLQTQNNNLNRMMTQLQVTQERMRRSEKLALAGKLASAVVHEVRNPLTVISTSLQLIADKAGTDHPDRPLYETMLGKARSVEQIMKELLQWTRPLEVRPQAVDLRMVACRVTAFVTKKYEAKKIRLLCQFPPTLPKAWADPEQMERILLNLLLNAHAFAPEQGWVQVTLESEPTSKNITLKVLDNGPGIPAEHLSKIFEPYFTTREEGTGLGLFLVKNLIEEMQGSVEARNHTGEGAEFIMKIPVAVENVESQSDGRPARPVQVIQ